jgi:BirA family biotin operon repressor/biotin-[acetyl-CoA-carboxylase] ligase
MEELTDGLAVTRVGRRVRCVTHTTSTNDLAWQAAVKGPAEADGLVVFAEYQSAGRGRRGNRWLSPPHESLLCSALVWVSDVPGQGPMLVRAAAVAAARAIEDQCDLAVGIKWPNDLVVDGRKVGGILVETRPGVGAGGPIVIGMGLNCTQTADEFPPEVRPVAASLRMLGAEVDRTLLARALLSRLDAVIVEAARPAGLAEIRRDAAARCRTLGERITVKEAQILYVGEVIDLDPDYGLILRLPAGEIRRFAPMTTQVIA